MRHSTSVARWLAAVLLVIAPYAADAAGLGRLTVQSSLGQPFRAEIDVIAVQKDELASLSARLAPPSAYQQAGLQYNNVVGGIALRIDQRPNGQPYIRLSTERPVNEFVVDVLIDLSWASGRIMREYRVLLDPPGVPAAPAVAESRPAPTATEAPAPRAIAPPPPAAAPGAYGPVRRGETLSEIARSVRHDGVSVEQMLVGLYRSNPEAFIRKNMNLMRSGKILRVPEREEVAAIPPQEAIKEYRAQVADWNSYRQSLAQAPAPAPEGADARRGRISGRVEDTTAGEARDVVRLSKGEPPAPGATGETKEASAKARIRTLEEEIVAREKALKEANERISQLEKTIKDMQRLVELKSAGMAAAQEKAEAVAKPEPQEVKEAPKPEPQKTATQPDSAKAPQPAAEAKPKPKAPVKPAAAPLPPEPSFVESLLANPLHLALIGLVLVGGAAFWLMRRRRAEGSRASALFAPAAGDGLVPIGAAAGAVAAASAAPATETPTADVDAVEEARIYVMHGRDGQAESILKDAIAKNPKREAAYLSLLEIYAARKDKAGFAKYAGELNTLTGGAGKTWLKAAAMGHAFDADNALYGAGKDAASAVEDARPVDLDLTTGGPATAEHAGSSAPASGSGRPRDVAPLDFNIELPAGSEAGSTASAKPDTDAAFKLPDIDLNLDGKPQGAEGASKDAHWYDVQTKFDLAKAYEEMGDKAGARQILGEVIREGDAEQQAQAKTLLEKLG